MRPHGKTDNTKYEDAVEIAQEHELPVETVMMIIREFSRRHPPAAAVMDVKVKEPLHDPPMVKDVPGHSFNMSTDPVGGSRQYVTVEALRASTSDATPDGTLREIAKQLGLSKDDLEFTTRMGPLYGSGTIKFVKTKTSSKDFDSPTNRSAEPRLYNAH